MVQQLLQTPEYLQAEAAVRARTHAIVKEQENWIRPSLEDWNGTNALDINLQSATKALLEDLGCFNSHQGASSSRHAMDDDRGFDATVLSIEHFQVLLSFLDPHTQTLLNVTFPPKQYTNAALLDVLAELALHPAAFESVVIHFKSLVVDFAARWLLSLGFDSHTFNIDIQEGLGSKVLRILSAFAKILDLNQGLYPLFLILLQHPILQQGPCALLHLDAPAYRPGFDANTNETHIQYDAYLTHPNLCDLLHTLHRLIASLPFLPDIASLPRWKLPQPLLYACMMRHPSLGMRMLAWRCVIQWCGYTAGEADDLRKKWVSNGDIPFAAQSHGEEMIDYKVELNGTCDFKPDSIVVGVKKIKADSWILPYVELNRLGQISAAVRRPVAHFYNDLMDIDAAPPRLAQSDLSNLTTLVEGWLIASPSNKSSSTYAQKGFVETAAIKAGLRDCTKLLIERRPILLSSASMSGKSLLITALSRSLSGNDLKTSTDHVITINLADRSIDAKSLLGSLASSPNNPGQFTFVEGTLTRAVRMGKWLVLRDIDKAADDVLALIDSMTQRLSIPAHAATGAAYGGVTSEYGPGIRVNGRWVAAGPGFALFATRQRDSSDIPARRFLGLENWEEVYLDSPSTLDLQNILGTLYPNTAATLGQRLIDTYHILISNSKVKSTGNPIRSIYKLCRRLESLFSGNVAAHLDFGRNTALQDEVFCEVLDVLDGPLRSAREDAPMLLHNIGDCLGLSDDRIQWLVELRQPTFATNLQSVPPTLSFGRATMPLMHSTGLPMLTGKQAQRPYAMSKWTIRLLERIAVAVMHNEPVLLVGETGTGKTAAVSHLAQSLGQELFSLNMSIQTEVADLLGGYKPVDQASDTLRMGNSIINSLVDLLSLTFSLAKNGMYIDTLRETFNKRKWSKLSAMVEDACQSAIAKLTKRTSKPMPLKTSAVPAAKRRKLTDSKDKDQALLQKWLELATRSRDFRLRVANQKSAPVTFAYVEGPLVKAMQDGTWILLDEINLASSEMLQSIATILSSPEASLTLTERGDLQPLKRHPNFRLFGCMNPATDVGKRDLPVFLRQSFTEFEVPSPDQDDESLIAITLSYIGNCTIGDKKAIGDAAEVYRHLSRLSKQRELADGTNAPPHYSIRTYCRALSFASANVNVFGLRRALFEGFIMAFAMLLSPRSRLLVTKIIQDTIFATSDQARAALGRRPTRRKPPSGEPSYFEHGHFAIPVGPNTPYSDDTYVMTASVKEKLSDLMRAISSAVYPILLQGPTSSGKTSLVEYIAKCSGNPCIRINNHQHTDIQEYLGSYVSDGSDGQLRFRDGLLVQALRTGAWIILDELNLAPSDVLEALNRLLDDNRQLVIAETQEVINPHPNFRLFATQNPPASYAGRKALSRAFRNRFLEFHFDDVPKSELQEILQQRCRIAPSYAAKIIQVFFELQHRRQIARIFEEKESFITLRDLFRWGDRHAVGYQELAEHGFMLVGERARSLQDRLIVKEVIESVMKVRIDLDNLYATPFEQHSESHLVWTTNTKRLAKLISESIKHKEPVLLVGETGGGKTSICEFLAQVNHSILHTVNCNLNTDVSDVLGGYRPNRDRAAAQARVKTDIVVFLQTHDSGIDHPDDFQALVDALKSFRSSLKDAQRLTETDALLRGAGDATALLQWYDGPLVAAMAKGHMFLLDEISLVDDSVLERFNSILEPARSVTLAEKADAGAVSVQLQAHEDFRFLATMNPGGDYGKKELSPALRNRFTEIWVPAMSETSDFCLLLKDKLDLADGSKQLLSQEMVAFARQFAQWTEDTDTVRLRDILAWADFVNRTTHFLAHEAAFCHGALLNYADRLSDDVNGQAVRQKCRARLAELFPDQMSIIPNSPVVSFSNDGDQLLVGPFAVGISQDKGDVPRQTSYVLDVDTVRANLLRLVRAMQINKPILLEGSPGVGKTSIVITLARLTGTICERVNLSAQTDISDLFGRDLPVVGGKPGEFAWKDAPFLQAMQAGHWVLLDEMNLAAQQILEGLNSCLDHRGDVYIAELGKTFRKHPSFRVFAAQNPLAEGGARKGLPASFLNRFSQIQVMALSDADFATIATDAFPSLDRSLVQQTILFNRDVAKFCSLRGLRQWEFNLRDITRFLSIVSTKLNVSEFLLSLAANIVYLYRLPGNLIHDMRSLFEKAFGFKAQFELPDALYSHSNYRIATVEAQRASLGVQCQSNSLAISSTPFTPSQSCVLNALATGKEHAWPILIYAKSASAAKVNTVVDHFSAINGQPKSEYFASTQTDSVDLLGSFEQFDPSFERLEKCDDAIRLVEAMMLPRADSLAEEDYQYLDELHSKLRAMQLNRLQKPGSRDEFDKICVNLRMPLQNDRTEDGKSSKTFVWRDGPLVNAITKGELFVLHNANLCPPAVLDRLNSLFETNGSLLLTEEGALEGRTRSIQAHSDFCMVMIADQSIGEVSRAMRNRSLEVFADTEDCPEQVNALNTATAMTTYDPTLSRNVVTMIAGISQTNVGLASVPHADVPLICRLIASCKDSGSAALLQQIHGSVRSTDIDSYNKISLKDLQFSHSLASQRAFDIGLCLELPAWTQSMDNASVAAESLIDLYMTKGTLNALILAPVHNTDRLAISLQLLTSALLNDLEKNLSTHHNTASPLQICDIARELVNGLDKPVIDRSSILQTLRWLRQVISGIEANHVFEQLDQILRNFNENHIQRMEKLWSALQFLPRVKSWPLVEVAYKLSGYLMQGTTATKRDLSTLCIDVLVQICLPRPNQQQLPDQAILDLSNRIDSEISKSLATETTSNEEPVDDSWTNLRRISRDTLLLRIASSQTSKLEHQAKPSSLLLQEFALEQAVTAAIAVYAADRRVSKDTAPLGYSLILGYLASSQSGVSGFRNIASDTLSSQALTCSGHPLTLSTIISGTVQATSAARDLILVCSAGDASPISDIAVLLEGLSEALSRDAGFQVDLAPVASGFSDNPESSLVASRLASIATILWHGYVGDTAYDPAIAQQALNHALRRKQALILGNLAVLRNFDKHLETRRASRLLAMLDIVVADPAMSKEMQITRRSDPVKLDGLFAELKQASHFFAYLSTKSLNTASNDMTLDQLDLTCANLWATIDRLQRNWADYADLLEAPILSLSLMLLSVEVQRLQVVQDTVSDERAPKSLGALPLYLSQTTTPAQSATADVTFNALILYSAVETRAHGSSLGLEALSLLSKVFDTTYQVWRTRQEANDARKQEENSTYFSRMSIRDEDAPTEDIVEDEDKAVEELFAQRENSEMISFAQCFIGIYDSEAVSKSERLAAEASQCQQALLESRECSVPRGDLVDHILRKNRQASHTGEGFHTEPHQSTIDYTVPLLKRLVKRTSDLLDIWPEQMILSDIIDRANVCLNMHSLTPPARLLPNIERLISAVNDWQSVASSEASLGDFQADLIHDVIRYRQIELASWSSLLHTELENFRDRADAWLFKLFHLFNTATAGHGSDDQDGLCDALSRFLLDSPIGQFERRLILLRSLCASNHADALYKVMTESIVASASRFLPAVQAYIDTHFRSTTKRIAEITKIAAWKDTNIDALRQSAEKNRKALLKAVKTFRKALQQSTTTIRPEISQELISLPVTSELANDKLLNLTGKSQTASGMPLKNVYAKVQSVIANVVRAQEVCDMSVNLSDLTSTILSTAATLRNFPLLKDDETKAKAASALLTRKRRAWAQFLRGLKRLGASANPSTNVLQAQRSLSSLHSVDQFSAKCNSLDDNYYKIVDAVNDLRGCSVQHSDDVSPLEVAAAIGSFESLMAFVLAERKQLASMVTPFRSLAEEVAQIASLLEAIPQPNLRPVTRENYAQLTDICIETNLCLKHLQMRLMEHSSLVSDVGAVDSAPDVSALSERLTDVLRRMSSSLKSASALLLPDEIQMSAEASSVLNDVRAEVERICEQSPPWSYLIQPVSDRITTLAMAWQNIAAVQKPSNVDSGIIQQRDDVISTVLLALEDLHKVPLENFGSADESDTTTGFAKSGLSLHSKQIRQQSNLTRLPLMSSKVTTLSLNCSQIASDAARACVADCQPFLQAYVRVVRDMLSRYTQWHQNLLAFTQTTLNIVIEISAKGFCRPAEQDSKADGEGLQETNDNLDAQGVGQGNSAGAKDISDQIENEGQVEGLQGEDDADNQVDDGTNQDKERPEGLDANELLADDGFMSDGSVSDDDGNDGSGDEQANEDNLDDKVEAVDQDSSRAVDEKFWNGDEEKEEEKAEAETEALDQNSKAQQDKTAEMAAKDSASKSDPQQEQGEQQQETEANDDKTKDLELASSEDDPEAHNDGNEEQQQPDDINRSAIEEKDNLRQGDDDEEMQSASEAAQDDLSDADDADMQDERGQSEDAIPDADMAPEGHADQMDEDSEMPDVQQESYLQETKPDDRGNGDFDVDQDETGGSGGQQAKEAKSAEDLEARDLETSDRLDQQMPEAANQAAPDTAEGQNADNTRRATVSHQSGADQTSKPSDVQAPLTPEEVLQGWQKRLQSIMEASGESSSERISDSQEKAADFEHADEATADTVQALAPSTQAEAFAAEAEAPADSESAAPEPHSEPVDAQATEALEISQQESKSSLADAQKQSANEAALDEPSYNPKMDEDKGLPMEWQSGESELLPVSPSQVARDTTSVARFVALDGKEMPAIAAWQQYVSRGQAQSFALTERLRLILEPTKASRLEGDYRSGKRLNMKRIIPYIASDFTKDKIWLKRTKPSDREYQVMICVDDSVSMRDAHLVQLAFESLAMIATALNRLEVGQVAVARFGESVEVLHAFDAGAISSDKGGNMLEQFTFGQKHTNYGKLLQSTLGLFEEARSLQPNSSGLASELWQLEIIISDGMTSDQAGIRRLMRQAAQQKVLIVFIIVDSPTRSSSSGTTTQQSILDIRSASYQTDSAGRQQFVMERYLDSFPFDSYVVVRDASDLPDMLSRTLKQFFEMVARV